MLKKVLFLGIFIALCCNGYFAFAQSTGNLAALDTDDGYVINSEMGISLGIYSNEMLVPGAVHEFSISYDSNLMKIDSAKGVNGVSPLTSYSSLEVNASIPGKLIVKIELDGFVTLIALHFIAIQTGQSLISITTFPEIYDTRGAEVIIVDYGDVNGDMAIDIVDALLIAQKYVGLPMSLFIKSAADVNCDNSIDIVDALLVAQYYVGLITEFPLCGENPTPQPTPAATPETTPTLPPVIMLGDVNGDGTVDIIDCLYVGQYISGVTPPGFIFEAADINGDGVIDMVDANCICYPTMCDLISPIIIH